MLVLDASVQSCILGALVGRRTDDAGFPLLLDCQVDSEALAQEDRPIAGRNLYLCDGGGASPGVN